jgi:hypothetical protein
MRGLLGVALAMALAGCASSANEVAPSYVSPITYQHLSCQQIGAEAEVVSQRAAQAAGVQDQKASNDAVATGVSLVLFWPAAFFIKGDGATTAELARLRGEFQALEGAARQKNCNLQLRRA